ncbi:MAG TPA: hypothetical protein VK735_12290 [Pseudonocardia sp.]|uniref:hypothetical protein n=1 Tax=Pseudonocardia sp. TaxID=60912 RepID=UPI002C0C22AE|nr:hypothetical protein [Pseudonocardia sp.]HTF48219.1 hypothetical protein [Pseudonocardia sp.]
MLLAGSIEYRRDLASRCGGQPSGAAGDSKAAEDPCLGLGAARLHDEFSVSSSMIRFTNQI